MPSLILSVWGEANALAKCPIILLDCGLTRNTQNLISWKGVTTLKILNHPKSSKSKESKTTRFSSIICHMISYLIFLISYLRPSCASGWASVIAVPPLHHQASREITLRGLGNLVDLHSGWWPMIICLECCTIFQDSLSLNSMHQISLGH